MSTELRNRLIFGPIIALVAVSAIAADFIWQVPYGVLGLVLVAVTIASFEYATLVRPAAPGVQRISTLVCACLLVLAPWLATAGFIPQLAELPLPGLIFGISFVWVGLRQFQRYATDHFVANVGATLLGICYLGLLPAMLVTLALMQTDDNPMRGHVLLILAIAAVKLGDVTAFFGGRAFGKHKMAPRISPGKTWEGFFASLVGSVGGTYLFCALAMAAGAQNPFDGWWQAAVWGLILGPVGVLGDLWESGIKRNTEVKDSGKIIPGFGGILDLVDAILLVGPPAYILAVFL